MTESTQSLRSLHESLSAAIDGEAEELELRRVVNAVRSDPELGAKWQRLHLAQGLMRGRGGRLRGAERLAPTVDGGKRRRDLAGCRLRVANRKRGNERRSLGSPPLAEAAYRRCRRGRGRIRRRRVFRRPRRGRANHAGRRACASRHHAAAKSGASAHGNGSAPSQRLHAATRATLHAGHAAGRYAVRQGIGGSRAERRARRRKPGRRWPTSPPTARRKRRGSIAVPVGRTNARWALAGGHRHRIGRHRQPCGGIRRTNAGAMAARHGRGVSQSRLRRRVQLLHGQPCPASGRVAAFAPSRASGRSRTTRAHAGVRRRLPHRRTARYLPRGTQGRGRRGTRAHRSFERAAARDRPHRREDTRRAAAPATSCRTWKAAYRPGRTHVFWRAASRI